MFLSGPVRRLEGRKDEEDTRKTGFLGPFSFPFPSVEGEEGWPRHVHSLAWVLGKEEKNKNIFSASQDAENSIQRGELAEGTPDESSRD